MVKGQESLHILYQDSDCLVVNKPGGLLSVPGRGPDKQDCVVSRVRGQLPGILEQPAVHRLDMATSGLMVLAKHAVAHRNLSKQFQTGLVAKRYVAILEGELSGQGEVRLAFRLDPENRPYQVYDPVHGKKGVSRWRCIEKKRGRSRVEFTPLTGRTHQLRLHASHPLGLGLPIVGDSLYGSGKEGQPMLLHAKFLQFRQPVTGAILSFALSPSF